MAEGAGGGRVQEEGAPQRFQTTGRGLLSKSDSSDPKELLQSRKNLSSRGIRENGFLQQQQPGAARESCQEQKLSPWCQGNVLLHFRPHLRRFQRAFSKFSKLSEFPVLSPGIPGRMK